MAGPGRPDRSHLYPSLKELLAAQTNFANDEWCICYLCTRQEAHRPEVKLPRGHCGCERCVFHTENTVGRFWWKEVHPEPNEVFHWRTAPHLKATWPPVCYCDWHMGVKKHTQAYLTPHCTCHYCHYHGKLEAEAKQRQDTAEAAIDPRA